MDGHDREAWREEFSSARDRFFAWRASRRRGERIPEDLWAEALRLAEQHGVSKTALTLKLDYYALQRRLGRGQATESLSCRTSAASLPSRFVEVSLDRPSPALTCMIEIEGRVGGASGSRLRLELKGLAPTELAAFVRTVWIESA